MAEEFLGECCQRLELGNKRLGKSGRDWIARRRWDSDPGEMRKLVYYAALCSRGPVIEAIHFPLRTKLDHEAYAKTQFEDLSLEEIVRQKVGHFFEKLGVVEARGVYQTVIRQTEKPLIEACLRWASGNQLKASRVLGINRNTLRRRMKELGISAGK